MELMNPNKLTPHPRNVEFFDDMDGQKWKDFLKSVETSGVIEPVIVTQDLVIVSGHQRVRACKALGINKVLVDIRKYEDEDRVLKDLIETNIMQRGLGNTNPMKLARCIAELERIEGIKNGGDRKSDGHNVDLKTQTDLAEQLKMSQKQLGRYKRLLDLIPELQTAVEEGKVSATNASAILARLPEDEQRAIAEKIVGSEGRVSKQELEFYKKRTQSLMDENESLKKQPPRVVEKVVEKEVYPDDYKLAKKQVGAYKQDLANARQEVTNAYSRQRELEAEIEDLKAQTAKEQTHQDDVASAILFASKCESFIHEVSGYLILADRLHELPERERNNYKRVAKAINAWSTLLLQNIERGEMNE